MQENLKTGQKMTRAAIMQPYIFPYLGYFQLIQAVDRFVFYDDVNFIKDGWIHRNKLIVNKKINLFTVPIKNASSFKLIKDTNIHKKEYEKWKSKLLKTIWINYKKAKHFEEIYPLVEDILKNPGNSINDLAQKSILASLDYLDVKRKLHESSKEFSDTKHLDRADRLIAISKKLNAETYINMPGGKKLYDKPYFAEKNIDLKFLKHYLPFYEQGTENFASHLSIIHLMMHEDPDSIRQMMKKHTLG